MVKPDHREPRQPELTLMQTFASEIISVKPLADVLRTVVRLMVEVARVDHATITLLDEDRTAWVVMHEYPVRPGASVVNERIPITGFPIQEAILKEKKPVIAPDLTSHALVLESPQVAKLTDRLDNKSVVILPMVCKDDVVGTISVDSFGKPRVFTADELDLYQTIANQAAVAIENARLFEQAQSLQKLYSDAYSAFSLERVGTRILSDIRKMVPCRKASVQLIVDDRRVLLSGLGFEKEQAAPGLLGSIDYDPIVKQIIDTKRMMVIPDTSREPRWRPQPETLDVRSWIGLPLVFGDRPLALITLDHDRPGFYSQLNNPGDGLRNSLEHFAARVAADLHEAYLFDAAQHHIQAFGLVDRVAERIGASLDTNGLLQAITSEIAQTLPCDQCSVLLLDKNQASRVLVVSASSDDRIARSQTLQVPSVAASPGSASVRAFLEGKSIVVNNFVDPLEASRFTLTPELPSNTRAVIAAPIKSPGRTLGVLVASRTKVNSFNVSDRVLLETLARHTGTAIERNTGLELVHRVAENALKATRVSDVLEQIVTGAMELTKTDSGVIHLLNDEGTEVIATFCPPGSAHPQPRLDNPVSITRLVMAQKRVLEIPDILVDDRVNPILRRRFRSMFAIPLLLGDRVVGVLYLNGREPGRLADMECVFLTTLANQAAIVIQRTRLDEQIRNSEAIYHSLIDHIPQMVFRKDRESRFTSANAAFCRSLNRPLAEIVGCDDYDFYPRELADGFRAVDRDVIQTGQPREIEERHQTKEMPAPIWVRVVKTPILDGRGDVTGVQAIFWDVTGERELKERYRSLVEHSPDSIIVHKEGVITIANPAAVSLFGVQSEADLKGHDIMEFVDPAYSALVRQRLGQLNRGEDLDQGVEMRVLRGTEPVDVAVYARLLPDYGEVQVVFHDLTRVKTLLVEMHHRVLGALSVVSNQLKDPATELTDDQTRIFNSLRGRINAIATVHRFLRQQRGLERIPMQPYLSDLADEVLNCYKTDVTVNCKVSEECYLDEKRALASGLIVTELVSNSVLHAFTPDQRGTVRVSLTCGQGHHRLTVSDDGSGFDRAAVDTDEVGGLPLVESLVGDDLGGFLEFTSRKGSGSTVVIDFVVPGEA
jgi:PAS domain S-box-containing protein